MQNDEGVECRVIELDFGRDADPIYPVTFLSDAWEICVGEALPVISILLLSSSGSHCSQYE